MCVARPDFADTFEKFIDYIDEDDLDNQHQLEQIKSQQPKRDCQYCKQLIVTLSADQLQNPATALQN